MKIALSVVLAASLACASAPQPTPTPDLHALIAAPDRPAADKALDVNRKPIQMLGFFQAKPGMKVADLAAGGGYTTELLARAVAPNGKVYSHNPPEFVRFAGQAWTDRSKRLPDVVTVERPMDSPLPPEAKDLDLVVSHAVYHDTVWMKTDREKMNRAVFAALRPGGAYVVIDSSAKPGAGISVASTLHRIDEQTVISEVEAVGFRLAEKSDAWRNPSDTRDWSTSPRAAGARRGTGDRFALRFVKP